MERGIAELSSEASGMSASSARGENTAAKALGALGNGGGRINSRRRQDLAKLKSEFHQLYKAAGDAKRQAAIFENSLSARRIKANGGKQDSGDMALEAAIRDWREKLDAERKELTEALAGLARLAPAAASVPGSQSSRR
jgi:hypothetical protein